MNLRLFLASALFAQVTVAPAYGGIDITPDPTVPGVQLGILIEKPPSDHKDNPVNDPDPSNPQSSLHCFGGTSGECRMGGGFSTLPPDTAEPRPEPTEGDVLRAARTIGLPSLQVKIQPGDRTLVNVPTIFHAEPRPFERSVTLLGFEVDLTAVPINFRWTHGDGTSQDTTGPGKPYPAMDVTHRYLRPADDVKARVDVTYRVRYRIDGRDWQTLRETLTASGPIAQLDVAEAAPVLTKP